MFGIGRFGRLCTVIARTGVIRYTRICFVSIALAVLRHPRDGVCPRRFAECCIVGHIGGDSREVCFECTSLLIGRGCPADEGVGMFGIGRFGGHFTVIARTGVIRYTSICFVSIALAVLRHPRDGVCPRCFAECCIVGHIVGDRREVCFGRTDLPIGLGCPADEGVRVLRIIRFRRVGPIKAWLCVVFYVVIRLERGNTILRLPRDGMARHCDFTGGDGEGDLFRICAAADREGRFAVEGGVVHAVDFFRFDRLRVDRDGVGLGIGVGGYLLLTFLFGHRFWMEVFYQIPFHACSFKGCRRDAGGEGIPDGAGAQAGDDGFRDGCKSSVQCIRISSIVSKLFIRTRLRLCGDLLL